MAIDYEKLKNWDLGIIQQAYSARDSMLYALGLGYSADPLDEAQLRYTYEENLVAVPTMAVVLAGPGFFWKDPATGVDWVKILHGEQGIEIHKPLPAEATVSGENKIIEIIDKGADKGALIYSQRKLYNQANGDHLATLTSTTFARGDGGFDGPTGPVKSVHPIPDREADEVCELQTLPQAALIYRLSGDYNPLHADPKVAASGGFKAPILHGLCSLGVAGHAILKSICGYDAVRFKSLALRFSSPVYPGETISTEIWREDDGVVAFRSKVVERDTVVLNNGRAEIA